MHCSFFRSSWMLLAFNILFFNISSCLLISAIFNVKSDFIFLETSPKYNFSSDWYLEILAADTWNPSTNISLHRTLSEFSCGQNSCKKDDTWHWNNESFNRLLFLCAVSRISCISGVDGNSCVLDDFITFGLMVLSIWGAAGGFFGIILKNEVIEVFDLHPIIWLCTSYLKEKEHSVWPVSF